MDLKIETNNQQKLLMTMDSRKRGLHVITVASGGGIERRDFIPEHELVMLYDYWVNCKNGTETSDYIHED